MLFHTINVHHLCIALQSPLAKRTNFIFSPNEIHTCVVCVVKESQCHAKLVTVMRGEVGGAGLRSEGRGSG